MEWQSLFSTHRLCSTELSDGDPYRSPFEKDMDRIVFSSAFRRMQDKTQVHPMPTSDYVRTRLTHSIEVASVGRSLSTYVGKEVVARYKLESITPADFGYVVSAACLAHDIGNPPFGHAGEDAIRHWFEQHPPLLEGLTPSQRADILDFEGNAQGFRIIAAPQYAGNLGGLQLTCATLGTFAKYPRASAIPLELCTGDVGGKKYGFFDSESALFDEVAESVGLKRRHEGLRYWSRHPLVFLVEAADDICYSVIDFEDGYKLQKLSFAETEAGLLSITGTHNLEKYHQIEEPDKKISFLRAKAIGTLIDAVSEVFLDHEADILAGNFKSALLDQISQNQARKAILATTQEKVYYKSHDQANAPGPHAVMGSLLRAFTEAVSYDQGVNRHHPLHHWLALPMDITFADRYAWLQWITDYIGGMTDSYAISLFDKLQKLPV